MCTEMFRRTTAKLLACALAAGMVTAAAPGGESGAAAKLKLSKKNVSIEVGSKKTISVKNAKKLKVKKTKWKIKKKKIATIKKSGKYAVKVTAISKGETKLTCSVKRKGKWKTLKCTVTVTEKKTAPTPDSGKAPSGAPVSPGISGTPDKPDTSAAPTDPVITPRPTNPVSEMSLDSLKDAYAGVFTYFGTCLGYNTPWNNGTQLQKDATMQVVQKQFNSFTLENEMKADQIFNPNTAKLIEVKEAKELGYVIPDSYKEATVPQLNFENVDKALEKAKQYGLKMRAHAPLWHQQTNTSFFKTDYSSTGEVLKDTKAMDARNEFYVKNVMKHVMDKEKELTGENGSIVYCWDVVNEYIHRAKDPVSPTWVDVYGDMGLRPTYVKDAFRFAYAMLTEYKVQDKVMLFYNDYDEYDCPEEIVQLVNYINEEEPQKICNGIGMQSHITTQVPTLEKYGEALDKFLATGLEIHVTELDIGIAKDDNEEVQAQVYADLMKLIMAKQKGRDTKVNPKGITGVTIWGLLDKDSWRNLNRAAKDKENALLFGKSLKYPKPSFYSVLDAAKS